MGVFYFNRAERRKQPPKTGYGFLEAVVKGVTPRAAPLVEIIEAAHQHGGNPGYPALAMLSAYVMQFALREPYANGFLDRLGGNERLLEICGLPRAPSERAYSQFKKKLANHVDLLQHIIADVFLECGIEIERLRAMGLVPADKPPLGETLVMDSTDIEARAQPGRKSRKTGEEKPSKDADARWGHRTAKNHRSSKGGSGRGGRGGTSKSLQKQDTASGNRKESNDELFFGYSANIIVDANYGLPLYSMVRPANASDVVIMIPDLDACLALYRTLSPRYFLGDKGYDSLKNLMDLVGRGMMPIVAIRRPPKDKATGKRLYDGIYDEKGRPPCAGGLPMEYVETDPEKGHLFRCPLDACELKQQVGFTGYCDDQHYEKPEGRLLRIVGLVPRCSDEWKERYKLRTVIERYNSSAKHSSLMNQHRYFNIYKVSLHVAMSMLSYLATALAHLEADDYAHMRHMRIRLPSEKGNKAKQQSEQQITLGIVAALFLHVNTVQQAA